MILEKYIQFGDLRTIIWPTWEEFSFVLVVVSRWRKNKIVLNCTGKGLVLSLCLSFVRQSWNDTCMLRHSKIAMLMKFVCFGIAKWECQMLNIIGYFFSLSYMPLHDLLKMKNMQRKIKSKKIKILYIWLQACILGDVGVIGCTSKVIVLIKQLWLCVS